MARNQQTDPYAPPPMHHDRSGGVVRFAIIAALLGAAAWGYMSFAGTEQQTAEIAPVEQSDTQQMADGSYQVTPQPTTTAAPQSTVPAPNAAPAPSAPPRSTTPAPSEPSEPVPPPSTSITPVEPITPG